MKTGQRRVAQPHDGECLESAEAGRVKTLSPLEPSEVALTILAPRTVRECIFFCLKPPSWWKFVTAASGLVPPRATDRGSVRAGWELLGCKTKAGPPTTGISEETLNERGRREVTGVHS